MAAVPEPSEQTGLARPVADLEFPVMASLAKAILVDPGRGAAAHVRERLEELEGRWSRFLPESDVTRLNTSGSGLLLVSPDSRLLLATMKAAWRSTEGRYDPTMLDAIVAAGYSRSIEGSGRRTVMSRSPRDGWPPAALSIEDVVIDPDTGAVTIPPGIGLDPGGIGKGLAADIVVTELLENGTAGALVSVGGDLAAGGSPPTEAGWQIAVEDPRDPSAQLMTFALDAGGVATSSTLSRAWLKDGVRRHHAIDPITRTCATTDLASATVVARSGWEAEAHATAALLCGSDGALDYLERHGLEGIVVTLEGALMTSPGLRPASVLERSGK